MIWLVSEETHFKQQSIDLYRENQTSCLIVNRDMLPNLLFFFLIYRNVEDSKMHAK